LVGWNRIAVGNSGLKLPDAVEAQPIASGHLGPGIFRQGVIGVYQAGPRRSQGRLLHLPWGRRCVERQHDNTKPNHFQSGKPRVLQTLPPLEIMIFIIRHDFKMSRGMNGPHEEKLFSTLVAILCHMTNSRWRDKCYESPKMRLERLEVVSARHAGLWRQHGMVDGTGQPREINEAEELKESHYETKC
jgi:hypothetical protein